MKNLLSACLLMFSLSLFAISPVTEPDWIYDMDSGDCYDDGDYDGTWYCSGSSCTYVPDNQQ